MNKEVVCKECGNNRWSIGKHTEYICTSCDYEHKKCTEKEFYVLDLEQIEDGDSEIMYQGTITITEKEYKMKKEDVVLERVVEEEGLETGCVRFYQWDKPTTVRVVEKYEEILAKHYSYDEITDMWMDELNRGITDDKR